MNQFETIITALGGSTVLAMAVTFLFKSWITERLKGAIKSEYEGKLETHKAQLKLGTDTALANIQAILKTKTDTEIEILKARLKAESDASLATLQAKLKAESDMEVEKLKIQLKAQSDVEIERLKSQLQIAASDRSIKLTKIFEIQAQVIADVHKNLVDVQRKTELFTKSLKATPISIEVRETERVEIFNAMKAFKSHYELHAIYLPPDTLERIKVMEYNLARLAASQGFASIPKSGSLLTDAIISHSQNSVPQVQEQISKLLDKLREDFQRILGTNEEKKPV